MSEVTDIEATLAHSGHEGVDAYLEDGFEQVRGMSSRFATAISAWLLTHQSTHGIRGHVAEIGAFEGRYLIALALALNEGEQAIGMDVFSWPNDKVESHFIAHGEKYGLVEPRYQSWKASSADLTPAQFTARVCGDTGLKARFIHIDGEHSPEALTHDLALALDAIHPQGLICLDDMLHPGYPFLVTAVNDWLEKNPDWVVMGIIDREDIVAAPKFLLCRKAAVALYEEPLMQHFAPFHFVLGGDARGHFCLVLTPRPRLAVVD
ncbi:MAG: class I SAM-dependent methyltransferase [Bosea sp. (in: a-proteobacteria)]